MFASLMRVRSAALFLALAAVFGCPSGPGPKPASQPTTGSAIKPRALRQRITLKGLLEQVEAPSKASRYEAFAFAARDLRRPLAYLEGVLAVARRSASGRALVADFARRLKEHAGVSAPTAAALTSALKRRGIDVEGPLAAVAQGRRLRAYFSVHDPKAFRAAIVAWAKQVKLAARWLAPKTGDEWQLITAAGHAVGPALSCRFGSLRVVSCAVRSRQDQGALTAPELKDSLWMGLRPEQRQRLASAQNVDALAWASSRAMRGSALVTLGKDALSASVEASGREVGRWAQLFRATAADALFSAQRAGSGEQLYLRLPLAPFARMLRGLPLSRWATGELLVRSGGSCKLPVALVGTRDPKIAAKALAAIGLLLRLSKTITVRERKVSGQAVLVLENASAKARRGRPALLPTPLAVTSTPSGWLVAPQACLAESLAAAVKPIPRVHHKPGEAPVAVGQLRVGDLLAAVDAKTRGQLNLLGRAVPTFLPIARSLMAALGQVKLRVRAASADRLTAQFSVSASADKQAPGLLASVVGLMAKTVLEPALVRRQLRVRTIEATEGLDKLKVGAKAYYQADHYDKKGTLLPKAFPPSSKGWTPKVPCCKQKGQRCAPNPKQWNTSTWRGLYFQLTDKHHYQFRFTSKGKGRQATYVIEARGDLDCDGVYSHYKLLGHVERDFSVHSRGPVITNELE
jgi:hypothetical protein